MLELSKIPISAKNYLTSKEIDLNSISLAIFTDRSSEGLPHESYAFFNDEEVILLEGITKLTNKKTDYRQRSITPEFVETSFKKLNITDLLSVEIDELISGLRFSLCFENFKKTILISSNRYRDALYELKSALESFIKGNKISDYKIKDKLKRCPKCGTIYPDQSRAICPKCVNKKSVVLRMGVFFKKYWVKIFIAILLLVLSSCMGVITPYVSSKMFYDEVLDPSVGSDLYGKVGLVISIIIGARILTMLFEIINHSIMAYISSKIIYDQKKTLFYAIQRLSLSFFTNRQTGGLITQVNNDSESMNWFFSDGIPYIIVNVFQVVIVTVIMINMSVPLTFAALFTIPFFISFIKRMYDNQKKLNNRRFSSRKSLSSLLSDILVGFRLVKVYSKEEDESGRFDSRNNRFAKDAKNASVYSTKRYPFIYYLLKVCNFLVWGFGGWMVIKGEITYGVLAVFVSYTNMVHNPLETFVDIVMYFSEFTNASSRLLEVMDSEPEVREPLNPIELENMQGSIKFENVCFSYEKNRRVINNVSFEIETGKTIGIVGRTGAGKSTIANLLIRLYDPESGCIKIDDIDIKNLRFKDIRDNVSIVSQETYLFIGTIYDNIKYAKPNATKEEVIKAAKISGAHDFIMKLPEAYSTTIGEGEMSLSGGERQRISIARALLKNPKILILDEATSAMDTETERKIQSALDELAKGKTTIMIAHRLSTLKNADKLIVIENGTVKEFGTHAELLSKPDGIYNKLYKLQLEALKNIGVEG